MTKTTLGNDMTNSVGVVYTENETKLSWPIRLGVIYDEKDVRQLHNRSYRYDLC